MDQEGLRQVTIPPLKGRDVASAKRLCTDAGLHLRIVDATTTPPTTGRQPTPGEGSDKVAAHATATPAGDPINPGALVGVVIISPDRPIS